jgi:hypothetical protein
MQFTFKLEILYLYQIYYRPAVSNLEHLTFLYTEHGTIILPKDQDPRARELGAPPGE